MTTTKAITQQAQLQTLYFMFANDHICVVLQSSVHHIGKLELSTIHA